MISYLLITVCTSAFMTDCRTHTLERMTGADSDTACQMELDDAKAKIRRQAPKAHVRFQCQTDSTEGGFIEDEDSSAEGE